MLLFKGQLITKLKTLFIKKKKNNLPCIETSDKYKLCQKCEIDIRN